MPGCTTQVAVIQVCAWQAKWYTAQSSYHCNPSKTSACPWLTRYIPPGLKQWHRWAQYGMQPLLTIKPHQPEALAEAAARSDHVAKP